MRNYSSYIKDAEAGLNGELDHRFMHKGRFALLMYYRVPIALFFFFLSISFPDNTFPYLPPPEQILEMMSKGFSPFRTVMLEQSLKGQGTDAASQGRIKIYLKTPDYYGLKEQAGPPPADLPYRVLLMPIAVSGLLEYLRHFGIDHRNRRLTVHGGLISYVIGKQDGARLIIEKERLIPRLLYIRSGLEGDNTLMQVFFNDYRRVEGSWYPFETDLVSREGAPSVTYVLDDIRIDPPIPQDVKFSNIEYYYRDKAYPDIQKAVKALQEKLR